MKNLSQKSWLLYALITTVSWGIWGALIEFPEKNGFPATMGYIVWAVTMIPCALIALHFSGWNLNKNPKSIILGMLVGLTGAGGQIALFQALREGPAYIIFPIVSLYPILTILLSTIILKESASKKQGLGIGLALVAIFLLSYTSSSADTTNNYWWLILAASVFIAWGLQAFTMKFSNESMSAESIFFYMALSANLFSPIAYLMTENSSPINYGWSGAISAFFIHLLNSIGALTLVYALRYGKSIIVIPLTGLSPVITIILSLILYSVWPTPILYGGIITASIALYLISE
ncbi:MAG: EamA family transporter [Flammeovirgaceae bacterium]|nr:EamA family transporter [Flammeovirgaceae bacterium]MBR07373.1 EamA family transporter [Rickettsiales bacterium]|tara:strand:- start:8130 stop:8999 length:870 start_codon:yes stop_codon:yes gene_type:complete